MDKPDQDIVVPVVSEELHADAVPVETGGVRVTKRIVGHDEILEQELRTGHVEVKRVKTERVVDGPQPIQRNGNTLIIPIVAEVLLVQKQWVVTEEIHLTQTEQRETVQQKVRVNREEAQVERLDETGNVVSSVVSVPQTQEAPERVGPESLVARKASVAQTGRPSAEKGILSGSSGILKSRPDDLDNPR